MPAPVHGAPRKRDARNPEPRCALQAGVCLTILQASIITAVVYARKSTFFREMPNNNTDVRTYDVFLKDATTEVFYVTIVQAGSQWVCPA